MSPRLNLLPDPRLAPMQSDVQARLVAAANLIDHETFLDVFDSAMEKLLRNTFAMVGAHEGTVWLADGARDYLVGVFNTGPHAREIGGGAFRQPLREDLAGPDGTGLVSMVFKDSRPFCENDVHLHAKHSKRLDRSLGLVTTAMVIVPFSFGEEVRGVISCVQLKPADPEAETPSGFLTESIHHVKLASTILGRLIDYSLIRSTIGLSLA